MLYNFYKMICIKLSQSFQGMTENSTIIMNSNYLNNLQLLPFLYVYVNVYKLETENTNSRRKLCSISSGVNSFIRLQVGVRKLKINLYN